VKARALLDILRRAGARPVSGAALARTMGVTRAAVHKRMATLRRGGCLISGAPHRGYRLVSDADVLDPSAFRSGWGLPFFREPVLASTQEAAKARALRAAPEGTLVAADRQTAGRGRLGRRWESPAGGLWFSLLLRPSFPPSRMPGLVLVAALDLALELRARWRLAARVKWPNDVWVGRRKVAGLLADMSSEMDRVQWAVLGVGVNVNNPAPPGTRTPAVSVKECLKKAVSRRDLLAGWMDRFQKSYHAYQRHGFAPFRKSFERASLLQGRHVAVEAAAGRLSGRVLGVDDLGHLRLKTACGVVAVGEGEVVHIAK
jgi:BirA family transcriptional regulator, biotin operon repressor / biotin---[acetyl-CoA-carboxylase] ligase